VPALAQDSGAVISVEGPTEGQTTELGQRVTFKGWAADSTGAGTGIDRVIVLDAPMAAGGTTVAEATYGRARSDVAAAFGAAWTNSEFTATWTAAGSAGNRTFWIYAHSTGDDGWTNKAVTVRLTEATVIQPSPSASTARPAPSMNTPYAGSGQVNQYGGQYTGQMGNQYSGQMGNQYSGQMGNQYSGQMGNQYNGQMGSQYGTPYGQYNGSQYGASYGQYGSPYGQAGQYPYGSSMNQYSQYGQSQYSGYPYNQSQYSGYPFNQSQYNASPYGQYGGYQAGPYAGMYPYGTASCGSVPSGYPSYSGSYSSPYSNVYGC
jgi:hypothetical protein